MAASSQTAMRGDIEGLRAIAVGTVVAYHLGFPLLHGGFAGVDVFFVISGFLITSLLAREIDRTGRISLADFYARRARRLLPAATVVLLATLLVGWFVVPATARRDLTTDALGATFYVINWVLAGRAVDYLAEDATVSPLQHYWSLSVEEQYYIVWPLIMLAVGAIALRGRFQARALLRLVLVTITATSFIYSILHTKSDPSAAYFVSTTRIWELGVGSLLALAVPLFQRLRHSAAQVLSAIGLIVVTYGMLTISTTTPWPGMAAAIPVLGSAAILAAGIANPNTLVARILSTRWMVWIGGLSYGIYLWHWPIIVLAQMKWPDLGWLPKLLLAIASVGLAWLSKRYVEDPIRFNRFIATVPHRAIALGLAMMAVVSLAAYSLRDQLPTLQPDKKVAGAVSLIADQKAQTWTVTKDPTRFFTNSGQLTPDPALALEDIPGYYAKGCQIQNGTTTLRKDCTFGDPKGTKTMALLGDSKMGQWFTSFNAIARSSSMRLDLYLKSACTPSTSGGETECNQYSQNVLASFSKSNRPDVAIISAGARENGALARGLGDYVNRLEALGTKVVILADNPRPTKDRYECAAVNQSDLEACSFAPNPGNGTPNLKAAARESGATWISLREWICSEQACPVAIGGVLLYRQGSHITDTFARTMTPIIYRTLIAKGVVKSPPGGVAADDIPRSTADWQ